MISQTSKNALQYLINTGESVTAEQFDDDHEPIGPMLRRDISAFVAVDERGILKINEHGRAALSEEGK